MPAWIINHESVSSDCLEGEVVAIHLGTGIYYSLRASAAVLWQTLATPADADSLAAVLTARFEIAAADARRDVAAFLEGLWAEELVQAAEGLAAPSPAFEGGRAPYTAPVFERFADLQDLLLLDPIHDVGAQGWPQRRPPEPKL